MNSYPRSIKALLCSFLSMAAVIAVPIATLAATAPAVTIHNYVRAETDLQMRTYAEQMNCFGQVAHVRNAYDVTSTATIRPNRDTIYSWGVFDLSSPLTVNLPDPGKRYQSLMMVSQDHYIWTEYGPKKVSLCVTSDLIGQNRPNS